MSMERKLDLHESLTKEEMHRLRNLAYQVAEIASDEKKWKEKKKLWIATNDLKPQRPMIMIAPGCWPELIQRSQISDRYFANIEEELTKRITRAHCFHDDNIIDKKLYVPYVTFTTGWCDEHVRPFDERSDHAAKFQPCIFTFEDFEKKMKKPTMWVDREQTEINYKLCQEIFGDILDVIKGMPYTTTNDDPMYNVAICGGANIQAIWEELHGYENMLIDLYEEPEFTKEAFQFITDGVSDYIDRGIEEGIWLLNNTGLLDFGAINQQNTPLGSNGLAWTNDLPKEGYNGKVRTQDLWLWCQAQDFTCVSPEMTAEFLVPYEAQLCKKFGMVAYGCCENIDGKYDIVLDAIDNIREFSCSAYSSIHRAVEKVGGKYVICWKPKPTNVFATFDPKRIEAELRHGMEIAKGMPIVVKLCEIETMCGHIDRAQYWIDTAMELAHKI